VQTSDHNFKVKTQDVQTPLVGDDRLSMSSLFQLKCWCATEGQKVTQNSTITKPEHGLLIMIKQSLTPLTLHG